MIDLERRLYDIITKYKLDRNFPNYRKKYEAEKFIRKWIAQWTESGQSVLVLLSSKMDMRALENFSWENEKIVYRVIPNEEECQNAMEEHCDQLVIGSLNDTFYIEKALYAANREFINLYEKFREEGLLFEIEWWEIGGLYSRDSEYTYFYGDFGGRDYGIAACMQFNRLFKRIQSGNITAGLRREYAVDCIFLLMYKKNFTLLDKYIDLFKNLSGGGICEDFTGLLADVNHMFSDIKKEFSVREQEDIIFYWIDSIDYYEKDKYPYISVVKDKGLSFENMYTVTGMTSPTYRSLFYQLREVFDLGYTQDTVHMESSVFNTLETAGYEVRIVSGYLKKDRRYWTNVNLGSCSMAGEVLWEIMKTVMGSKKPVFCLAHLFPEPHSPYMGFDLEGNIGDFTYSKERSILEQSDLLRQYDELCCGNNATKIYMSDHGRAELTSRHHTFFIICNKKTIPAKYYEMTTLLDFHKMIEDLIKDGRVSAEGLGREYVPVESLVYYNRERIKNMLFYGTPIDFLGMGYTGMATKDMLYLKSSIGVEYLRQKSKSMIQPRLFKHPDNIADRSRLGYFRERTEDYPLELNGSDNKFKYSRYLYKALELMDVKRVGQIIKIVNEWFMAQEDKSVIIRTGGRATWELLRILEKDAHRKISGIADNDKNCFCSDKGHPIIQVDEMIRRSGTIVFITSLMLRDVLKNELKGRAELTVVDLYDLLDQNGVPVTCNFFVLDDLKMTDEIREKLQFPEWG